MLWLATLATWIGALPLVWCVHRSMGRPRLSGTAWMMASGFGVSVLADLVIRAHPAWQWIVSPVYLVSQGAFLTAAIVTPYEAWVVLMTLVSVGSVAVLVHGVETPDVLLHTTAFLAISAVALRSASIYRWSLLVSFGVALLPWLSYCAQPGWVPWGAYQLCRLIGVGLYCWAVGRE